MGTAMIFVSCFCLHPPHSNSICNELASYGLSAVYPETNSDARELLTGFHSDLNETFFIGDCDEESQRLVRS